MTAPVTTDGFVVPPVGGNTPGNTVDGGVNLPPSNPTPGWVPPAPPKALSSDQNTPAPTAPAAPAAPNGMDAAIAALAAALQAQKPAPVAETPAPAADSLNAFDPNTLQDPVLRSMATVMQTVGKDLDMDRVFAKALETGDPEFIDVAYLKERGGANADQLVTIAQGIIQAVNAQAVAIQSEVHALAGSEANWNACTAAFNQNAPQALRQVVATMMDSGNKDQVKAASSLVIEFSKGSGFVPTANPTVQNGGAGVAAAQALSKDEFQVELRKLNVNDRGFEKARDELFARRQLGKKLGK